jgi:SNF2 family DNA or RNA helicase
MLEHVYGTLSYVENRFENSFDMHSKKRNSGQWKITGPQPTIMALRIVPGSYSKQAATVMMPDNICNVEYIEWLMKLYPLKIVSAKKWDSQVKKLHEIRERRTTVRSLSEAVVGAQFTGTLRPFQKEGLDFLNKTSGLALIADEMGLGKTIEALAYLVTAKNTFPCLIVAQLVTLINWEREIHKFIRQKSGKPFKVQLIRTGAGDLFNPQKKLFEYENSSPQIYIINYELLSRRRDDLEKIPFKTIIADECQNIRHSDTLKAQALIELSQLPTVEHKIGLSGSPCYNNGLEIWSIVNFIYPGLLGTFGEFAREFVNPCDYHRSILEEKRAALHDILTENIMIRRRKADVCKELPQKIRYRQTIQINKEYYESMMQKHLETLNEKLAIAKAKTKIQSFSETSAYEDFSKKERITAGIAKVPYTVEFVNHVLETGEPVVVFCHYKLVRSMLTEALSKYNPVFVIGGQTDKQRQEAIDAIQTGKTKLLIAGLTAGNVGINLTAASYVVFAELDWSPARHRQAEDRLHRIGQTKTVFAYYLEGKGTHDEHISEVLVNKKLELDEILGDSTRSDQYSETETLTEQAKAMVKKLTEKYAKIGTKSSSKTQPEIITTDEVA